MENIVAYSGENMQIGDNIRRERLAAGLTQQALADKLGTTQQLIVKYEKNLTTPTLDRVQDIADALGIPAYRLLQKE